MARVQEPVKRLLMVKTEEKAKELAKAHGLSYAGTEGRYYLAAPLPIHSDLVPYLAPVVG